MLVKYDRIGKAYNTTRCADTYLSQRQLHHLKPEHTGLYLDIGCGTGNYTNEFQKKGYRFIGVDPSQRMLDEAKSKNENVDWQLGKAEVIDLNDNFIDGIIASLTLHHWDSLQDGFHELYRVLKPNGRFVIFTSTQQQMKGYWLNHYFPKMLQASIVQMPKRIEIIEALKKSGFKEISTERYSIKPDLEDKFLYCGKNNPNIYFDDSIRNGISSFSDLANSEEVQNGLVKLKKDINSGYIETVQKNYSNNLGDYLFLVTQK